VSRSNKEPHRGFGGAWIIFLELYYPSIYDTFSELTGPERRKKCAFGLLITGQPPV
jgi:hypothetical protein